MNVKKVVTIYNDLFEVDLDTAKLVSYDNAKKRAVYNAHVVENGKLHPCCVDFACEEIVTDVEKRLSTFGSPLKSAYAFFVDFNSDKNDPGDVIWNKMLDFAKNNQSMFFYKNGNLKKVPRCVQKIKKALFEGGCDD